MSDEKARSGDLPGGAAAVSYTHLILPFASRCGGTGRRKGLKIPR